MRLASAASIGTGRIWLKSESTLSCMSPLQTCAGIVQSASVETLLLRGRSVHAAPSNRHTAHVLTQDCSMLLL